VLGALASPALGSPKRLRLEPAASQPTADGTLGLAARHALRQGYPPVESEGAKSLSERPDHVGTQRFIQLVNSQFAIYNKDSTTPISTGSLKTLANASSADTLFDVQVIWDPTTKRFYYTMIDAVSQTNNKLAYGYSKDASPTGGSSSDWCKYSISYGAQFPDYPKLGDSKY
jgi:hypothetical protein